MRATVVEMLADLGYRVLKAARCGERAGDHRERRGDRPAVHRRGDARRLRSPELARRSRERLPHIAVLFTSGYTENAIVHGGRLDAGVELLPSPITREALARKIRQVLQPARRSDIDRGTFKGVRAQ